MIPSLEEFRLIVQPIDGETGRYYVQSQGSEGKYMVDLNCWDQRGECTCQDWVCRIGPAFAAGELPPKPCCKHIHTARAFLIAQNYDAILLCEQLARVVLTTARRQL